jgi:hypothetical protein
MSMFVTAGSDGGMSMGMRRGGGGGFGGPPSLDDFEFAEVFPPFQNGRTLVSPAGEAWVERMGHVSVPMELDIFDGQGVRIATVEMPQGSRLIGFGHRPGGGDVAYVARMDEVGLWWLERYRIER